MVLETPHRILIYHPDSGVYREILTRRLPNAEIHSAGERRDALGFIEKSEIILAWRQIPDDLLKKAKSLRWFSSLGAGNEDLVKNPFLPETVIFTKATVYGEMMTEYVFAYLLYFLRGLPKYLEGQKRKVWDRVLPGRLRGQTLGILGLGSIGREIAKRGKQFGMNILGVKRDPEPIEDVDQVFVPGELGRMIPLVDDLVVVLPLTSETYHLLGERELNLMKAGTLLMNIGRGKTIDERALVKVLKTGRMRAILDVFEEEPLPPESELWTLENVIITPHVSGINLPAEICEGFARNYERWLRGEPLLGLVDREKGY